MFPPIPAPFAGSTPEDNGDTGGLSEARMPVLLDRAFSAFAVLCAAAAGCGLVVGGGRVASADALGLICAALLLPALLGMWLMERAQAQQAPNLAVTRIFSLVRHRLNSDAGALAVARQPHEESYGGLAGLIADSVRTLRRLQAGRLRTQDAAAAVNAALQAGRDRAGMLAVNLRRDAASLADAASGIMVASARLETDVAAAQAGSQAAQLSVSQVIDRAGAVAGGVGSITTQINRMTVAASSAAQSAFGAHASVAGLAERSIALCTLATEAGDALTNARTDPARHAALAQDVAAVVATMQSTVAELQAEAALAMRHVAELSSVIANQQDAGAALSHAVDRQGAEIRQVLVLLQEAHAGFDQVREGVAGVSRHGADRLAEAEAIRGAAHRLPAHADVIAAILRNIPDFTPTAEI